MKGFLHKEKFKYWKKTRGGIIKIKKIIIRGNLASKGKYEKNKRCGRRNLFRKVKYDPESGKVKDLKA